MDLLSNDKNAPDWSVFMCLATELEVVARLL